MRDKKLRTIAIIPDGNRRWARSNLAGVSSAYDLGIKKFLDFSEWCCDYGIDNIIVWGLSTENVGRPKKELDALFGAYMRLLEDKQTLKRLSERDARLILVGNRDLLPERLLKDFEKLEWDTRNFKKRRIYALFGYGGEEDIMHIAEGIARDARRGKLQRYITKRSFRRYLLSKDVPDIDLVIRTSGELRLSGFMPWQTAYAELYFAKKYWPAFTRKDFEKAISDYMNRERRFGV
ncbi:MAG: polyprenyl diphosphate synthase [Candidatus Micrarchaeaceae archaeon]